MAYVNRVLPVELAVGDRILLNPLAPFATRQLTSEDRAAAAGPTQVVGFGAYTRGQGTVLVRTAVFDADVPVNHRVAVVSEERR